MAEESSEAVSDESKEPAVEEIDEDDLFASLSAEEESSEEEFLEPEAGVYTLTHTGTAKDVFLVQYKSAVVVLDKPGACMKLKENQFKDLMISDGTLIASAICDSQSEWEFITPLCEPGNYNLVDRSEKFGIFVYDDYRTELAEYNHDDHCYEPPSY